MGDPVSALIPAGIQLLSSSMAGDSAQQAAQTSANAQIEAARIAAEEARFRPIGVTTRFGQSQFGFDPSGRLSSAGYTVSPELQAYQNRLMGLAGGGLTQAEQAQQQYAPLTGAATGLFNLGQQYLSQSPEQAAQKYMEQQQALLAPSREQQSANLMNQLSNTGRTGLSVAQGGGLMAANPEAAALANARAMQDLQLAAQAQQAGQQQTAFGAGLFGTGANLLNQYQTGQIGALSPFQAYLGATQGIESLGQQPLQIGSELGGRASNAGANAGQFLYSGATNAARTMQPANALDPFSRTLSNLGENRQFTSGLGNLFGGRTGARLDQGPADFWAS
jgi:hypothetical protein